MDIALVKQTDAQLSDEDRAVVRRFLMENLSGATDKDTRAWNRFVRAMDCAAQGEFFQLKIQRQRDNAFHRKHMGLISKVFKAQERVDDFEAFRLWLKVGSGFVDWMPGPKGGVFPVPRSIDFNRCSEDDMREFHDRVVDFLRKPHAQHYLFPHATPAAAEQGIEAILSQYERF